jgi:RNA polymerase sigma-70 factor, ECF subfamily
MPASYHPAPRSSRLPPSALELKDHEVVWGEESAVFELPAPRPLAPGAFDDTAFEASSALSGSPSPASPVEDVGQLFSNYRGYVAKIGRRILGPSSEVEDLIQDVFLATVRDAHKIKDPARLSSWLGTVTTRMAKRRRFRSNHHPVANDGLDDLVEVAADEGPGPESTADMAGNIRKLLSLPEELRTPWLLKHVEGHTLEDVAKQCDCSLSTAARRIQTASTKMSSRTLNPLTAKVPGAPLDQAADDCLRAGQRGHERRGPGDPGD